LKKNCQKFKKNYYFSPIIKNIFGLTQKPEYLWGALCS
jgi:hypothetical protein